MSRDALPAAQDVFASFPNITFPGCLLENANGAPTLSSVGLFPTRELLNRCWGGNLIKGYKPMREVCVLSLNGYFSWIRKIVFA